MNPRNRMEKAIALHAIADKADDLARKGTSNIGVQSFIAGARQKLAEERPDPEKYNQAANAAALWSSSAR